MSLSPFDVAVNELTSKGFSRETSEAAIRARFPHLAPCPDPDDGRAASILEKAAQIEIRKRFIACGFVVYNLSQSRASKQTPGLPDLWLVHRALPIALWWESKRPVGGRFSPAQLEFASSCHRARIGYGAGSATDAEQHLISIGRAEVIAGVWYPIAAPATPASPLDPSLGEPRT